MNKSDIHLKLNELYPKLSIAEIKDVVDKIISSISDTLIDNNRAEIRGFGSVSLKTVHKTVMRNPRDATVIENPHIARIVYFRAGKDLRIRVNKLNQP